VLGNKLVESVEVTLLLVIHVLHEGTEVRVAGDDGGYLRGVDACRG
jgi:hypothetical protein